jgi:hypothetical protein
MAPLIRCIQRQMNRLGRLRAMSPACRPNVRAGSRPQPQQGATTPRKPTGSALSSAQRLGRVTADRTARYSHMSGNAAGSGLAAGTCCRTHAVAGARSTTPYVLINAGNVPRNTAEIDSSLTRTRRSRPLAVLSGATDGGMAADSAVPRPAKPHHTSLCAAAFRSPGPLTRRAGCRYSAHHITRRAGCLRSARHSCRKAPRWRCCRARTPE